MTYQQINWLRKFLECTLYICTFVCTFVLRLKIWKSMYLYFLQFQNLQMYTYLYFVLNQTKCTDLSCSWCTSACLMDRCLAGEMGRRVGLYVHLYLARVRRLARCPWFVSYHDIIDISWDQRDHLCCFVTGYATCGGPLLACMPGRDSNLISRLWYLRRVYESHRTHQGNDVLIWCSAFEYETRFLFQYFAALLSPLSNGNVLSKDGRSAEHEWTELKICCAVVLLEIRFRHQLE